MSRRVNTLQLQATGGGAPDSYFDKVVKYIPGDIVAAWITVTGLIKAATGVPTRTVYWVVFIVGLLLTSAWTWKQTNEPGKPVAVRQIAIATAAFIVWVIALGPPFDLHPLYASLLLIGYTLAVGLVDQ